jgi:hypothetical protein
MVSNYRVVKQNPIDQLKDSYLLVLTLSIGGNSTTLNTNLNNVGFFEGELKKV